MYYCDICPNNCKVDREQSVGRCLSSNQVKIAKYSLHPFEEPIISGQNGSGTIFFCGCSLKCVFCQNYEVSRNEVGKIISTQQLAEIFKTLEQMGATNINLVNPTHFTKQIIEALNIYRPNIPIVWNTHGYEKCETIELINEYVDVYLTDLKYCSPKVSFRYTGIKDYFEVAIKALDCMLKNKKTILYDGLMKQGVIVRHLILPLNTNDSVELLTQLKQHITEDAYLSLMAQYTPFGDIDAFPELKRKITHREYKKVLNVALNLEFNNIFTQEDNASDKCYIPNWDY